MISLTTWTEFAYSRALVRPIATSHGVCRMREGMILRVTDADGIAGLGDAAPLTGFSRETLTQVRRSWLAIKAKVAALEVPPTADDLAPSLAACASAFADCPSLRFAVESALSDLASRRAGVPLARWFSPEAAGSVEVNALVDANAGEGWVEQCRARWEEGYRTYKMKAGAGPLAADIERASILRSELPEALIRIDVNGGWTAHTFKEAADALARIQIEFIEQPLDLGLAREARTIARAAGLQLALDEELSTPMDAERVLDESLCDVLVIKPMALGALSGGLALAREAGRRGAGIVFTSLWESDIGIAAALHLAAATQAETACGFSTAGAIAAGIVADPLRIDQGTLTVPRGAGLGIELDPALTETR